MRPTDKFPVCRSPGSSSRKTKGIIDNANPGQDLFLNVLIHNQLQNHSCPNPVKMPTSGRNVFRKALTINTLRVSQMPDTPPVGYRIASSMEGLKNND